jgi:hypothetical protein
MTLKRCDIAARDALLQLSSRVGRAPFDVDRLRPRVRGKTDTESTAGYGRLLEEQTSTARATLKARPGTGPTSMELTRFRGQ